MKAILDEGQGIKSIVFSRNFPKPVIRENEILVQMKSAAISTIDVYVSEINIMNIQAPYVPGGAGAGIVVEKGSAVYDIEIGSRVCFYVNIARQGVFAEYVPVLAHVVTVIPDHFSFEQVAHVPFGGYLAYHALHQKINMIHKKNIFIQEIGGTIGSFVAILAKKLGLTVIASGHSEHLEFAKKLNVDFFIDHQQGLSSIIPMVGTDGLDIAIMTQVNFDKFNFHKLYDIMAFNGDIFSLVGFKKTIDLPTRFKNLNIRDLSLIGAYINNNNSWLLELKKIGTEVLNLFTPDELESTITNTASLLTIPEVYMSIANGYNRLGKTVVLFED